VAPVLVLPKSEIELLKSSVLFQYYFVWGEQIAIVWGYGSLYNHNESPTATFEVDFTNDQMAFSAVEDIPAHEEITTHYHNGERDKALWFKRQG
jgi:hypothetical protein